VTGGALETYRATQRFDVSVARVCRRRDASACPGISPGGFRLQKTPARKTMGIGRPSPGRPLQRGSGLLIEHQGDVRTLAHPVTPQARQRANTKNRPYEKPPLAFAGGGCGHTV